MSEGLPICQKCGQGHPLERSMAQGVTDSEWTHLSEGERWATIGEVPYEPDPYEPGGLGWMED